MCAPQLYGIYSTLRVSMASKRPRSDPSPDRSSPCSLPSLVGSPSPLLVLTPRRTSYSLSQKTAILDSLRAHGGNKAETLRAVNAVSGFEKVQRAHLDRWARDQEASPSVAGRPGRPVDARFERAVLERLVYTSRCGLGPGDGNADAAVINAVGSTGGVADGVGGLLDSGAAAATGSARARRRASSTATSTRR